MEPNSQQPSAALAKGQLWKTTDSYLQIVNLENKLIHYKLMQKPAQPAVTRLMRTDVLAGYLKAKEATLMS
jgi:hypothetical protein